MTIVIAYCPQGMFYPADYVKKKNCHFENIIILLLNNTSSLSTGPTVLISYITVMFYKTTNFQTLFFLLLKICSFTVKSVFSSVHHECKLHGENFYITFVNVVHSYNKNEHWLYLVVILGKTVGGGCFTLLGMFSHTLPYIARLFARICKKKT